MHNSLEWMVLPQWLYLPLMDGVISQRTASELFDLWLQIPQGQTRPWPRHLLPIRDRLDLYMLAASPTKH